VHRFVHDENIRHYKQLLERMTDAAERQRILNLLAEEEAKLPGEKSQEKSGARNSKRV
jgi:hypothetical protein